MAKMTLLEMTQNILNAMDSDEVNSIDDTVESAQVAEIIKDSYFYLMSKRDWPFLRTLTQLTGMSDEDNPTQMAIPDDVNKIFWIKYNGKDVTYLDPKDFLDLIQSREEQSGVVNSDGYIINADPTYWTTYDDSIIWFDGYDSDTDTTLQSSKSDVYAVEVPSWSHVDGFTPNIPEKFFPTLLAEAKSACFVNIKQQVNAKEESKARAGRVQMQKEAWRNNKGEHKTNTEVNYGRK